MRKHLLPAFKRCLKNIFLFSIPYPLSSSSSGQYGHSLSILSLSLSFIYLICSLILLFDIPSSKSHQRTMAWLVSFYCCLFIMLSPISVHSIYPTHNFPYKLWPLNTYHALIYGSSSILPLSEAETHECKGYFSFLFT